MNFKIFILLVIVFFISSCAPKHETDVTLITTDNLVITGTFHKVSDRGLILLHQLNSDRHSYDEFAKVAMKHNYSVMAIDFRGHGNSERKWQEFTDEDFQAMETDVKAANEYMRKQGIKRVYIIGASIGANTAINYGSKSSDIEGVIALSPSFNYRGISTRESILTYKKPLMIMVSEGDSESFNDSMIMAQLTKVDLIALTSSTHGTYMLENTTITKILEWLE